MRDFWLRCVAAGMVAPMLAYGTGASWAAAVGAQHSHNVGERNVGQQKVGNVRLTFQDLVVPVGGVPITITRTYDSISGVGEDFGRGWKLDLVGDAVEDAGQNVILTLPNGRRTRFALKPVPLTPEWGGVVIAAMAYVPRRGSHMCKVEPMGPKMAFMFLGKRPANPSPHAPPGRWRSRPGNGGARGRGMLALGARLR